MRRLEETENASFAMPPWHCPSHGVPLAFSEEALSCRFGETFPIVGGIPRFTGKTAYVEHFGKQWNTYVSTQLDSYTGLPISRDRLRRAFGEELWGGFLGKMFSSAVAVPAVSLKFCLLTARM